MTAEISSALLGFPNVITGSKNFYWASNEYSVTNLCAGTVDSRKLWQQESTHVCGEYPVFKLNILI